MVQLTQFDVAELDAVGVPLQPAAPVPISNTIQVSKGSPGHFSKSTNSAASPVLPTTNRVEQETKLNSTL